jgi:hypothetical protein
VALVLVLMTATCGIGDQAEKPPQVENLRGRALALADMPEAWDLDDYDEKVSGVPLTGDKLCDAAQGSAGLQQATGQLSQWFHRGKGGPSLLQLVAPASRETYDKIAAGFGLCSGTEWTRTDKVGDVVTFALTDLPDEPLGEVSRSFEFDITFGETETWNALVMGWANNVMTVLLASTIEIDMLELDPAEWTTILDAAAVKLQRS